MIVGDFQHVSSLIGGDLPYTDPTTKKIVPGVPMIAFDYASNAWQKETSPGTNLFRLDINSSFALHF